MIPRTVRLAGVIAAGLSLGSATALFASRANAPRPGRHVAGKAVPTRVGKRNGGATAPAIPSGPRPPDSAGSDIADETITRHRNALGQTVYSVSASRFDISPPLRDLAVDSPLEPAVEDEPSINPHLPSFRTLHSGVSNPVVQAEIPPPGLQDLRGAAFAPPTTGFNFAGVGSTGSSPSDDNGSVGNDQYVETVNKRFRVWSLDRSTSTATGVLGPSNISTLWSGFGGPCETQNSGDPIVLFDKVAGRWLISQFTSAASLGVYYQCVALSSTSDATGTYARWAFAVPGGLFGDYPHLGVWTDAYYMMAHGFVGNRYATALFAALDRPRMLQGLATATWQVIEDAAEGGHMPADLDGYAPPPTDAPGIFLSVHDSGMRIYRMKVDFVTPANTVRIVQASVPVAGATGACELAARIGTCIPQPGSTGELDALGDRLMFRAAYRNFIDHESLVVTHSVDPSVPGVVSGVRWYDFRLSGPADPACPEYPCVYQQGTIADVANGRSRWMPSIAMDAAENVLVGYSASGKINLSENHTIRYTGRARQDPAGVMTVPEVILATGDRNEGTLSRWGDYTSMSVDPFDDCTFWYVNQYYAGSTSLWSTRIASASWPPGSGPGQCPAAGCTARPASAPTMGVATVTGDNQITITWVGITPVPGAYAIERADGACGSEGLYRPLAATGGGATSFTDTSVEGGLTYSYRVIAAADVAGRCQALIPGACVDATATGICSRRPVFTGASSATSNGSATCGVSLSWAPAASSCPLTPGISYNIYRGTAPDFVPSAANRIATCVPGPGSYLDTSNLVSGTTYYYVVRAEDGSSGNGGACGGGNEDGNGIVVPGTPYGAGTQATPGTWTDGGGDGTAFMLLNVAGPGDTGERAWRFVSTSSDPGANHTPGGAHAYRNAGPVPDLVYVPGACVEMQTPPLVIGAATTTLKYWERHQLEYHWDGVTVEYSRNGGAWTTVPAPSSSTAAGCAATDVTAGWESLECSGNPPTNGCGYPAITRLFSGPLSSGNACNSYATGTAPTGYAHRCHPIAGLTAGDRLQFRWRFTSDQGAEYRGFYLDDVVVTNVRLPDACTPCIAPSGFNPPAVADASACLPSGIDVTWTAPVSWGDTTGARTFSVQRDGMPIVTGPCSGNLPDTTLACVDTPGDSAAHTYTVRATNGCGSVASSAAGGGAADDSDVVAPTMTVLYLVKDLPSIDFVWTSAEPGATYITYRTIPIRMPSWVSRNVTSALSWTDTGDLASPSSYFYSTTAEDACGNQSPL